MSTSASIKQRFGVVTIEPAEPGGELRKIVVRRMPWSAQRALHRQIANIIRDAVSNRAPAEKTEDVRGVLTSAIMLRLPEVVASSDEMLDTLILGSTEMKLDEFQRLDSLVALEVIRVSLEINFDEELKNSFAAIVNNLAGLMVAPKTTSSASSTPT